MLLLIKGGTWDVTVWEGMSKCREGQKGQPVSSALIALSLDLVSSTAHRRPALLYVPLCALHVPSATNRDSKSR